MNDLAVFLAAYWLWGDEEGHTVHFSDAKSAYRHAQKGAEYEFLRPYYARIVAMGSK